MTLLAVAGLGASLGGMPVLDDVSFSVAPGEFVGLIGPNGAGKSTLLKAVLGLVTATGAVTLDGADAARLGTKRRAALVAYLAQERDVAWPVSVEMLVSLGRAPHRQRFGPLSAGDRAAVDAAMRRMDVGTLASRATTALSGGELARALIARALAQETPLLLADEPAAGLDPAHQIALMRIFAGLAAEGRSIIVSLHDLGLAARWCSRLLLVEHGRLVADGTPREVLTPERIRTVYGVDALAGEFAGQWLVQPLDLASPITKETTHA